MAFDDLTRRQIQTLTELIQALESGNYSDEFAVLRRPGQQRGVIYLYDDASTAQREIEGFTDSDTETLKEEGYMSLTGGKASLKQKAFQQYKLLRASVPSEVNSHLERLRKLYRAVDGSQHKAVVLSEVLADEGLSVEEAWKEANYMEGEGWVKILADNGPPLVEMTHPGIKTAEATQKSPVASLPANVKTLDQKTVNKTLQAWAGAHETQTTTLALVFTDIVSSTDIGSHLGDNKWIPIVIEHFAQARRLIAKYDGYLIKVIGDACMVAFRTTVKAFHFAMDFYIETGHELISIRAAIHFGHVWIVDNDIYGSMVNLTSRIQHTVAGHGIAFSDPAAQDILGVLGKKTQGIRFGPRPKELKSFGVQKIWQVRSLEMVAAEAPRTKAREKFLGLTVPTAPTQQKTAPKVQANNADTSSLMVRRSGIKPRTLPVQTDENDNQRGLKSLLEANRNSLLIGPRPKKDEKK